MGAAIFGLAIVLLLFPAFDWIPERVKNALLILIWGAAASAISYLVYECCSWAT